ncbi:MAG: rhodanese-like domain-containing protein [Clostridia bacterium]|nr:rhodanese-like domain-containing protein [Clostridia bacterium]
MSDIGGDLIAATEANLMLSNGAVLVDVRSAEEFAQGSAEGSVNIPLDEIASLSDLYDNDQTIIFCCASGTRAGKAVEEAKVLGFTNTYNGGSYTNY